MEFLPSSIDLSSPKAAIVQTSLAVVVLTAIGLRFWFRRTYLPLIQPPLCAKAFTMTSKDFGDQEETRRDVSRAYVGGAIYLQLPNDADGDSFTVKLSPPPGSSSGVDKAAVQANIEAFVAELRAQLPEHQISDASIGRILPSTPTMPHQFLITSYCGTARPASAPFFLVSHSPDDLNESCLLLSAHRVHRAQCSP